MGFDALMLGHQIYRKKRRLPRVIAHKLWFLRKEISVHAAKLGMVPATFENGVKILEQDELLLLFPEGEEGNFKPTRFRYRLRRFRRGFVRLALATGATIVPAVVIGAEETHITLSQLKWAKPLIGIIIPIPFNVFPLPAKWSIRFLEPIRIEKNLERAQDLAYVNSQAKRIRHKLQRGINEELRLRRTVFI
jgi:1-acyl-sn-glycerol-3-phosphate acyltransferase